jgi:hypothetical protein
VAWGATAKGRSDGYSSALGVDILKHLEPARAKRLQAIWNDWSAAGATPDRQEALEALGRAHQATARIDVTRIHPTWWARALQEESPGVQRVVATSAPELVRRSVADALLLDSGDMATARPVHPEVKDWVLALWTERLVGGEPDRPDAPPVIHSFSRLTPREGYLLCRMIGIAKGAVISQVPAARAPRIADRERWDWLRARLESLGDEILRTSWNDLRSARAARLHGRHVAARVGIITIARLLAAAEPVQVRWAIQHWPYPIAKLLRSLMSEHEQCPFSEFLERSEPFVLKTAWDRLTLEKRVPIPWPARD